MTFYFVIGLPPYLNNVTILNKGCFSCDVIQVNWRIDGGSFFCENFSTLNLSVPLVLKFRFAEKSIYLSKTNPASTHLRGKAKMLTIYRAQEIVYRYHIICTLI